MSTLTVIVGSILLLIIILLAGHIGKILKQLEELDKEQHTQNMDIIRLMKNNQEMREMLLQHIEILKYLCEQDPMLGRIKIPYTGPIGEA